MGKAMETEIERLFQLPPDQFTAARNALAKGAGAEAGSIRALTRPPVAAWAVNQLYWRDRDRYEALVEASNEMRKAHRAVIEGRQGDLRGAGREHEAALEAALKSTLTLMKGAGQPATDSTRHAVLNTLRALPSDAPPGRLTEALTPGGFELLAGVTPAAPSARKGRKTSAVRSPEAAPAKKGRAPSTSKAEREAARERERRSAAERAVREADQRARQAEFEAARAAREATKAEERLAASRAELEAAQQVFAEAEKAAVRAARARETADRRLREARSALDAARRRT